MGEDYYSSTYVNHTKEVDLMVCYPMVGELEINEVVVGEPCEIGTGEPLTQECVLVPNECVDYVPKPETHETCGLVTSDTCEPTL